MPGAYEIEVSEPDISRCECCDGLTVRVTGFVSRGDDAFAIYYARYSTNHPEGELGMLVSLGAWGEGSAPSQRTAFYCRVRAVSTETGPSYEVMLGDAAASPWADVDLVGAKLSRAGALAHPDKATAFAILDEAFVQDPSLRGFVQRADCGHAGSPLELGYDLPDDAFALPADERAARVESVRGLVALDGERFFVRCLLPLPVEGYGKWSIGLWVETSREDWHRLREARTEPGHAWAPLSGVIANDIPEDVGIPVLSRMAVEVGPDDEQIPVVVAVTNPELQRRMSVEWPRADFERWAVVRGYL